MAFFPPEPDGPNTHPTAAGAPAATPPFSPPHSPSHSPPHWRFDPADVLSPEEVARLRTVSNWKGVLAVVNAWAWIFATMAVFSLAAAYAWWAGLLVLVPGVMIVGGRQLGLAVLMHDAAHGILIRNRRLNDWIGQWLCGAPTGTDLFVYRAYHLRHHRHVQQPEDPDLGLSAPFPITGASLRRKIIRDLTGQTFLKQRRNQFRAAWGTPDTPPTERLVRAWRGVGRFVTVNLILLCGLGAMGQAHLYVLLWLVPMATWLPLVTRIRNIAEHAMVPDNDDPLRNARTTLAGPLVRLVLAPYQVNYHVEHHMMMWVPHYNLPLFHRMLMMSGYAKIMEIQPNYFTVLRRAASKGCHPDRPEGNEPDQDGPVHRQNTHAA